MVPEEMRVKRSKKIEAQAPSGTSWCAGCQSFRDVIDFGKGATQCRACLSARTHGAMVEKVYGITSDEYDRLLELQGGRCAICRARPKSKRLAVDHDHKSGAVRGLLCSRCNHDLLGSAWDSLALATALWHYMNTPPVSGEWSSPETAPPLVADPSGAVARSERLDPVEGIVTSPGARSSSTRSDAAAPTTCTRPHVLPTGAEAVPGKRGVWRVYVEDDSDVPF